MSTIPVKKGISAAVVTAIPKEWDATWFKRFVTTHLVNADIRNAVPVGAIQISADFSTPATITVSPSGLANIANNTVLGNVSGSTALPIAITTAQLTTLVNTFSSSLSGAVPASGGGTTNFLRADGSFTTPSKLSTETSGWGTPSSPSVIADFDGAGATLSQATQAIAQIITDLKELGFYAS